MQCTAGMPCRYFADRSRIFAEQKYGSEGYRDVPRTTTARIWLMKSRVEKRLVRFSFIRAEAFIPHPFGCNKRYESRLQFLMRTHSATFTAHCVIRYAKKSCAGNFASCNARQGCRVVTLQTDRVFLQSKNTVVRGTGMYPERPLLGFG